MKTFLQSLKRQEGFTLVELMVVVAIIGLLSAVAIPNFKKYQAKSKSSEAKLHLSAMYTAEQSFFSDYNIYSNCLRYMGYDPSGEAGSRYYVTGFPQVTAAINATAFASAVNSGLNSGAFIAGTTATINGLSIIQNATGGCPIGGAPVDGQTLFLAAKMIGTAVATAAFAGAGSATLASGIASGESGDTTLTTDGIGSQATDATMAFRAVAAGIIDSDNILATNASVWVINENKLLMNPRTGY